jgi:hypothetical protein
MVAETPEVKELARLIKLSPQEVADVMEVYQHCDPYLKRKEVVISPWIQPCSEIWRRYGNGDTEQLASLAQQLKVYFES